MSLLLSLAWRNVWRNRTRSLIIVGSVALGMWAALFLAAFYQGMVDQRMRSIIRDESSHLQLHHPAFPADLEPRYLIPAADSTAQALRVRPGVRQVAPRALLNGMISSPTGTAGVRLNGVDPVIEDSTTHLSAKLVQGSGLDQGKRNGILVSERLAKKLKVKLRSKVVILTQDTAGGMASGAFRIQGIYRTINAPYDDANVFITRAAAGEQIGVAGACHEIAVLLEDDAALAWQKGALARALPHLEVKDWKEVVPEAALLVESFDEYMAIFSVIIFLGLAFGLVNTMLMAVLERTREIGMLVSIGMGRGRVFRMVVLETVFLVLVAVPVGLLVAWASIAHYHTTGIDLRSFSAATSSFGFDLVVRPATTGGHVLKTLVMVVLTALLSAAWPAWKALRINATEAIRK